LRPSQAHLASIQMSLLPTQTRWINKNMNAVVKIVEYLYVETLGEMLSSQEANNTIL
jgi:hypothetical protein